MTIHNIKLKKSFCDVVMNGEKSFEVRFNDRGYQKGDIIQFKAVNDTEMLSYNHPINDMTFEITYVLSGWGLKEGFVVLGIKPLEEDHD